MNLFYYPANLKEKMEEKYDIEILDISTRNFYRQEISEHIDKNENFCYMAHL